MNMNEMLHPVIITAFRSRTQCCQSSGNSGGNIPTHHVCNGDNVNQVIQKIRYLSRMDPKILSSSPPGVGYMQPVIELVMQGCSVPLCVCHGTRSVVPLFMVLLVERSLEHILQRGFNTKYMQSLQCLFNPAGRAETQEGLHTCEHFLHLKMLISQLKSLTQLHVINPYM